MKRAQCGVKLFPWMKRGRLTPTPPLSSSTVRGLWLAITVLTAILVGASGGLLAWAGGMNPPTAILTGGGAFTGTVLLVLTMLRFVTGAGVDHPSARLAPGEPASSDCLTTAIGSPLAGARRALPPRPLLACSGRAEEALVRAC
jgi:hypothetical protein